MNQTTQEAFNVLAAQMDKRQDFYIELDRFHDKHGYIPEKYLADWYTWITVEKRVPWRQNKVVVRKLKKAARKAAKNT